MFLSWHGYSPKKKNQMKAPRIKAVNEISIIIPVKNNQQGVNLFFKSFFETHKSEQFPSEIIIVDNPGSTTYVPQKFMNGSTEIRVLKCDRIGPASARNMGWRVARSEWILFTDSDCIPSSTWLKGYLEASDESIGYAGYVSSFGLDFISRYYESQRILLPSCYSKEGITYPDYLITAYALVWKKALEEIGGFNDTIKIAAGEDIDLGFRLREIGDLSFAPNSLVYHNFDDGLLGFIKRFKRYGKGNHTLSKIYSLNMRPRGIRPRENTLKNLVLSHIQYLSLFWGYRFG